MRASACLCVVSLADVCASTHFSTRFHPPTPTRVVTVVEPSTIGIASVITVSAATSEHVQAPVLHFLIRVDEFDYVLCVCACVCVCVWASVCGLACVG